VRDCVVTLQADRLVGYLTARDRHGVDPDDVRAFLRDRLPGVMVPTSLVMLDALPRTPNGKVDRRALPAPARIRGSEGGPPRGPNERRVAEVWREILDLDEVCRDDDFFELGGHSLHATRVHLQLRLRGDLDVRALERQPIQYRDYAVWQRRWLRGETLGSQVDYWRHLSGAVPALALPVARRRSTTQGASGGRVRTRLTAEQTAAIRELRRRRGVTVFTTMLASLATVLRRWSARRT
jgi:hypothetical protein